MHKILLFLSLSVFSQSFESTITGKTSLKNQNKKIKLYQVNFETKNDVLIDSISLHNDGNFNKIIKFKEFGVYNLVFPDNNSFLIAIDNIEHIKLNFTSNPISVSGSVGTQLLLDYEKFRKNSFEKWMRPIYDSISKYEDLKNQILKIYWAKKQPNYYNLHRTELTSFVRKNMINSTASYASCLRWNPNTDIFFIDSLVKNIEKIYSNTLIAVHMRARYERIKSTAVGSIAPEIAVSDTSGKNVSLHSKKGNYVLLDFWASWCRPCRQMSDQLVEFNQTFKNKNVVLFSVSIDDKIENWKKAILKDNYSWTNVSDLLGWKSKPAFDYNINAIPSNILIDKNGIILAKNINIEDAILLINNQLEK